MYDWYPPPGSYATFSLSDLRWSDYLSWKKKATPREKSPKLRRWNDGLTRLRLDDPRFVELIEDMRRSAAIRFDAVWIEEPPSDPNHEDAWFQIKSSGPMFYSASRARPDHHMQWGDRYIASKQLKKVIEKARLRGLRFLPIEGTEKTAKWFNVFATAAMGRGFDHPLSNGYPDWRSSKGRELKGYERRFADGVAWISHLRPETRIADELIRETFRFAPRFDAKRIEFPVRFAKEFVPEGVDFAYFGWRPLEGTVYPDCGRRRRIMCTRQARDLLIASGLLKARQFKPHEVIPSSAWPIEPLDAVVKAPIPLPTFTPAEYDAALARMAARRVKKSRTPPLAKALKALSSIIAGLPMLGPPVLDAKAKSQFHKSKLFAQVPTAWKTALTILPSNVPHGHIEERDPIDDSVTRFKAFELVAPERNTWIMHREDIDDPDSRPSRKDIVLARTPDGDWFAFRLGDPALPAEARITLWDHETEQPHFEWPSVAAFVHELTEAIASKSVTRR